MQHHEGAPGRLVARDSDARWVQWLTHSRRYNPKTSYDTVSSSSSSSSSSKASSTTGGGKYVRSCSSATSYFATLSANESQYKGGASSPIQSHHSNVSGLMRPDLDTSWVTYSQKHRHTLRLVDTPDRSTQAGSHDLERQTLYAPRTLTPVEDHQHYMTISLPQQQPAITSTPNPGTTTSSAVSSSVGTTSPMPFSLGNIVEPDVESLNTLSDLLPNMDSAWPFDLSNLLPETAAEPYATVGFDGGDLTWLEQQPAFPLSIDESSAISSPSKRDHEEYSGDLSSIEHPRAEESAQKKRKVSQPWSSPPRMSSLKSTDFAAQSMTTDDIGQLVSN